MGQSRKIPTYQELRGYLKVLPWYLMSKLPEIVIVATLLLLSLLVWTLTGNAQEVDVPAEVAIEEVPAPELEQPVDTVGKDAPIATPPLEGGVVVEVGPPEESAALEAGPIISNPRNQYDDMRLQIMSAQALSFESTGEYTQIGKAKEVVEGDSITFDAVKDTLLTGKEEIHVYEAPCGRGWQLIIYDDTELVYADRFDTKGKKYRAMVPIERSYGYGCEHDARTYNW